MRSDSGSEGRGRGLGWGWRLWRDMRRLLRCVMSCILRFIIGAKVELQLFDLFLSSPRTTKEDKSPVAESQTGPLCHIIHISACHPDESQHPSWNQTTNLDTLTWKTLPDELRKVRYFDPIIAEHTKMGSPQRNVNLNVIMLKPNKSFAELHASVGRITLGFMDLRSRQFTGEL